MPGRPKRVIREAWFSTDGRVLGEGRHQAREFLKFPRQIDKAVPGRRDVHLVLDNHATHKTPDVKAWLDKQPCVTPTGASWPNLVECVFAEIARLV